MGEMQLGSRVFVSHASADGEYAASFVEIVLEGGCDLSSDDYFFSSFADTGVPSGSTLLECVRKEVVDAGLIVALVTPTYQARPVCIAELGVAWGLVENLFPLMAPGMGHSDAEGVLGDRLVAGICDEEQLDALMERVAEVTGKRPKTGRWTRYKKKWLSECNGFQATLSVPSTVTADEAATLRTTIVDLEGALADAEAEVEQLQERLAAVVAARTKDDVAEALVPSGEAERLAYYRDQLHDALLPLPTVAVEAVYLEGKGESLVMPDPFRDSGGLADDIDAAERGGHLYHHSDDDPVYSLDRGSVEVEAALVAYEALDWCMSDVSEEYGEWFRSRYKHPPELARKPVWKGFVLDSGPAGP